MKLAQKNELHIVETFAHFRLADLKIRLGEWATAEISLGKAEQLAHQIGHRASLISIHRAWAEIYLASMSLDAASDNIQESIVLANELEETLELGKSLRVIAQLLLVEGSRLEARKVLEESLTLLVDEDPYEAARTMVKLGMMLESYEEGKGNEREVLLEDARMIFERLGAKRELTELRMESNHRHGSFC